MRHYPPPPQTVLDLGTGSGILAIAAAHRGAAQVLAIDIDAVAVRTAKENVAENGVAEIVTVRHATIGVSAVTSGNENPICIKPSLQFDLAMVNIVARVIAEHADHLGNTVRPGGTLIASGILAERETVAVDALTKAGFAMTARHSRRDWIALQFKREN